MFMDDGVTEHVLVILYVTYCYRIHTKSARINVSGKRKRKVIKRLRHQRKGAVEAEEDGEAENIGIYQLQDDVLFHVESRKFLSNYLEKLNQNNLLKIILNYNIKVGNLFVLSKWMNLYRKSYWIGLNAILAIFQSYNGKNLILYYWLFSCFVL